MMDFRTAIILLRGGDTLSRISEYGHVYAKGIRVDAWGRIVGEDGYPWSPSADDLKSNDWSIVRAGDKFHDINWAIDEARQGRWPAREEWLCDKYMHHIEIRGAAMVWVSGKGEIYEWTPTVDEILAEDWIIR